MQAANVGAHVAAGAHQLAYVVLDVTSEPGPVLASTAQGGEIVKIGVGFLDRLKLIAVIRPLLMASAIHQPEFMTQMPFRPLEEPIDHAANGRDSRSRGDKD